MTAQVLLKLELIELQIQKVVFGLPTGTRTPIDRFCGFCFILLSYRVTSLIVLFLLQMNRVHIKSLNSFACLLFG